MEIQLKNEHNMIKGSRYYDIIEMHFIEIPKLEDNNDEKDMLVAWTDF